MIIPDHKKAATVIISRLHDSGKTDDAEALPGDDTELVALAADLLRAVNNKETAALADAFRAMFLACESKEDEGPEEV